METIGSLGAARVEPGDELAKGTTLGNFVAPVLQGGQALGLAIVDYGLDLGSLANRLAIAIGDRLLYGIFERLGTGIPHQDRCDPISGENGRATHAKRRCKAEF